MKTLFTSLFLFMCMPFVHISAQELCRYNFESYEQTPYFFRFGNKGALKEYTYKPRWVYSHTVEENPVSGGSNVSSMVLKYTSQEAKNYGLKVRFLNPLVLNNVKTVQFKIYQPKNVIGKPVDIQYGSVAATQQNICIKLLSQFSSVNDFRQEDGILMYLSKEQFTKEGEWVTFSFNFNSADYASQLGKFSNGVMGVAILPTYDSNVTLTEKDSYVCYIDDIVVNPVPAGIETIEKNDLSVHYADGKLNIQAEDCHYAMVRVCDMQGKELFVSQQIAFENGCGSIPVSFSGGVYIVSVYTDKGSKTGKFSVL